MKTRGIDSFKELDLGVVGLNTGERTFAYKAMTNKEEKVFQIRLVKKGRWVYMIEAEVDCFKNLPPKSHMLHYQKNVTFSYEMALSKKFTKKEAVEKMKEIMRTNGFQNCENPNIDIDDFLNVELDENKINKDIQLKVEKVIKENTHKRFNPDSCYARIVIDDLGYDWNNILFKDRWVTGYLIKFMFTPRDDKGRERLEKEITKKLSTLTYPFTVKVTSKNSKVIMTVPYYR